MLRPEAGSASATSSRTTTSIADERAERGSYAGCIAGALSFGEFREGLAAVGLDDISITSTHEVVAGMHGAIIKATKPIDAAPAVIAPAGRELPVAAGGSCCGGEGCC